MTVGIAWLGERSDGRQHLFFASDSRVRGGQYLDVCPKVMALPRSDCAICFAGDTGAAYPLMIQMANAISAHQPTRERALDITRVKDHLLRVFTDVVRHIQTAPDPFVQRDAEFLFGGYSWLRGNFALWTIQYSPRARAFFAREAKTFHPRLQKAAFVGDWGTRLRGKLLQELNRTLTGGPTYLAPLRILADLVGAAGPSDSIGGAPQLLRVTKHMNTQPLCVKWGTPAKVTLFGRPLFDYENCDYWVVDPISEFFTRPRKFGHRDEDEQPSGGS